MTVRFRFHSIDLPSTPAGATQASVWLTGLAERHELSEERRFHLDLCAGEALANIAEHSYRGVAAEVRLEILLDQDAAILTVIDSGPNFNPLNHPAPEPHASIASVPIGGLGIHLMRRFADEISYERAESRNRLTLRFGTRGLIRRTLERRTTPAAGFPLERTDGAWIEVDERDGSDRRAMGFISRIRLFQGVPTHVVEYILAHCEMREFTAGEVLFRSGEQHRCVLVNIEGRLEVHLDEPDSRFFVDVGPGECVGELSVADGQPNSAWVVAATSGRLLVIPEPVFLGSFLGVPTVVRNLIVVLSERMRHTNLQIVDRLRATLELEALQRELGMAHQIQSSMLPAAPLFVADPSIEGHGFMRAARQVGGDFYDAFQIGEGRYFAAIGDVCSKGMPAALFMVRTLTSLRSEALRADKNAGRHLARLAARCNDLLCEGNEARLFVTMFCAIIDMPHGQLHFVNIGQNPPLLLTGKAEPELIDTPRNPLAGLVPDLKFAVGTRNFPPGSRLLLYSDGITEAESSRGNFFGDDALFNLMSSAGDDSVDGLVERIVGAVDSFAAGYPQSDDITLLAIHRI